MQEEIINNTTEIIAKAIGDAVEKARKEAYETASLDIQVLREQVDMLYSSMEEKNPFQTDRSFVSRYTESVEKSFEKGLKVLSESHGKTKEELLEVLYFQSGGISLETPEEHAFFIRACREKARYSPFVRNIKNIVREAALSAPLKIDLPNEELDTIITDSLKKAKFFKKMPGWIENEYIDSEIFIAMFIAPDGRLQFREIDPLEILDIEFHPEDKEVYFSFKRCWDSAEGEKEKWYAHANYEQEKGISSSDHTADFDEDTFVFYFKYGYRAGQRGEIPLQPILRFDRIYEDVLLDLARLYHERSSVVWILKLKGNNPNVHSRTEQPVRGAKYKIETDNKEWRIEDTKLSDFNSDNYARPHRLAMAAGVGIPEYQVFQDISNQSYSSLRRADGPLSMLAQSIDNRWAENISDIVQVILREYAKRGILGVKQSYSISRLPIDEMLNILQNPEYKLSESLFEEETGVKKPKTKEVAIEDMPVSVIFPKQQNDNPLLFAQSLAVMIQSGFLSRRTAAKLAGLDPDNELSLISLDTFMQNTMNNTTTGKTEQPATNYDRKIDKGTV